VSTVQKYDVELTAFSNYHANGKQNSDEVSTTDELQLLDTSSSNPWIKFEANKDDHHKLKDFQAQVDYSINFQARHSGL
jgi:hypothetical protein